MKGFTKALLCFLSVEISCLGFNNTNDMNNTNSNNNMTNTDTIHSNTNRGSNTSIYHDDTLFNEEIAKSLLGNAGEILFNQDIDLVVTDELINKISCIVIKSAEMDGISNQRNSNINDNIWLGYKEGFPVLSSDAKEGNAAITNGTIEFSRERFSNNDQSLWHRIVLYNTLLLLKHVKNTSDGTILGYSDTNSISRFLSNDKHLGAVIYDAFNIVPGGIVVSQDAIGRYRYRIENVRIFLMYVDLRLKEISQETGRTLKELYAFAQGWILSKLSESANSEMNKDNPLYFDKSSEYNQQLRGLFE